LCTELPELRDHAEELFCGAQLRSMPTMALYAYLRAALACVPGRTAKKGDRYDVNHLICGMSRCDTVTADRGMYEMVRSRKLLPQGCSLYESSDVDGLRNAIAAAIAEREYDRTIEHLWGALASGPSWRLTPPSADSPASAAARASSRSARAAPFTPRPRRPTGESGPRRRTEPRLAWTLALPTRCQQQHPSS